MVNPQDSDLRPEEQGAMPTERPIPPISNPLKASFLLALDILDTFPGFLPDGLIVVDSAGTIVLANRQLEALFGYSQDELIGQRAERLLPEYLRAAHAAHQTSYQQAAHPRPMDIGLDLVGRRKDGSQFPVDLALRPLVIGDSQYVMGVIRDRTARDRDERKHEQILERLRQQDKLISLAYDAILVRDAESRIVSWNEGAEHLYGWTAQEATGKIIHRLLQTRFPISQEAVDHTLEQHGQWQGDLIHTCRDGMQVIVESRQVLVRDKQERPCAILEINRDVTEQRRLHRLEQEARAESEARLHLLQLILDRLPNGVFLVQGQDLRLVMANAAATDLWGAHWAQGQTEEEFFRQHGIQVLIANGQPLHPDDLTGRHVLNSGEPMLHRLLVIRHSDGTRLPVMVDAIPMPNLSLLPRLSQRMAPALASAEQVVLVVYQDVSALKKAEALKDEFISLATHELLTPVTIISAYADRLLARAARGEEHLLDAWQRDKVQQMKLASRQLASLTEDLLDVTRMQAGQFKLHRRPTDLVALTRQVIERMQGTTDRHQLALRTAPVHLWASVDASRIEQVLSNLLSNAIKYNPKGGPIEATLEEDARTRQAHFRVHDQGMGIPRAQQAHIFGRFVRGENARLAGIRGTGLGLYLCRELIERHGGSIGFESEEGVGSTFFFSLPCTEPISAL